MADYIDRETALSALGDEPLVWVDTPEEIEARACWERYVDAIKNVPAADVKPVVLCKHCMHSYESWSGLVCSYGVCFDCVVNDEFYCANGEVGAE